MKHVLIIISHYSRTQVFSHNDLQISFSLLVNFVMICGSTTGSFLDQFHHIEILKNNIHYTDIPTSYVISFIFVADFEAQYN